MAMDGKRMNPNTVQLMLEIINGGPEIGTVSPEERFNIVAPTIGRKVGKIFVTSTVADMDKNSDARMLWDEPTTYKLKQ